jgi:CelD/BcsL family acetyltransferase involved in cellulose biosynthesis
VVCHRTSTDAREVSRDLDTIFELHDARWTGLVGSRAFKGREAFHHDFVQTALARGWLRLHVLELDHRPVAALYNLRYSGAEYAYQAGRVPELASCSLGTLLHAHAIRAAADDGLREYRFLRGTEPYKLRFADRDAGLESIAVTTSTRSRAVLAAVSRIDRYPRWLRRAVPASIAWGTGGTPSWGPP